MVMVNESFQHLCKKAAAGEVAADVLQKVGQLAADVAARNFPSASAIQAVSRHIFVLSVGSMAHSSMLHCQYHIQDLANTVWNQHKDWIKGLKVFIQVAAKK